MNKVFMMLVLMILLCSSTTYARNALTAPGFDRYMAERNLIAFLNGDNIFTGNNTFYNVTYLTVTIVNNNVSGDLNISGDVYADSYCYLDGSCINKSAIYIKNNTNAAYIVRADKGYFTELNVSKNSIYIGDVKLSSNDSVLDVSGNVSGDYFIGSGKFLTDINLSNVNGTSVFNGDVLINGNLNVSGTAYTYRFCYLNGTCINRSLTDSLYVKLAGDVMYGNLNFTNAGIYNTNYVQFNTTYNDGHVTGRLQWNSDEGVLEYGMTGNEVNQQIGQEIFLPRIRNKQGTPITNCQIVYISGATGNNIEVKLVNFSNYRQAQAISGMVTETSIGNNQHGYATSYGVVHDCNTLGMPEGSSIFGDPNILGGYTTSYPGFDKPVVFIGIVVKESATNGTIWYNPLFVPKVEDMSYINWSDESKQRYSLLQRDNLTGVWSTTDSIYLKNISSSYFCQTGGSCINLSNIGTGGNTSWNQTLANTLYAPLGTGGNTSWNQTLADSLYAPLGSNVTADSMWNNNVNYAYIKADKPQAINVTKTCLSSDCSNYQLIEKNITSTVISWY